MGAVCAEGQMCITQICVCVCVISDHNKNTRIAAGIKIIIVRYYRMVSSYDGVSIELTG